MKNSILVSSPAKSRQVRQQFASPDDYLRLSYFQIKIRDGSRVRDTLSLVVPKDPTDELRTLFDNQFVTLNQVYCSDYEFDTSRNVVSLLAGVVLCLYLIYLSVAHFWHH